jgi:hypothetical protein
MALRFGMAASARELSEPGGVAELSDPLVTAGRYRDVPDDI